MVFASLIFLYIFLPLNLLVYFGKSIRDFCHIALRSPAQIPSYFAQIGEPATQFQNLVLVAFSMLFYVWGEPIWLSLLLYSSAIDWKMGQFIEKYQGTAKAKIPLIISLLSNLSLLAAFKYCDFFVGTVNGILGLNIHSPGFSLPIGISFYTFQTISYVIDVYRGEVKSQRKFLDFLLFVSLYHQLVAGPIVRYVHIAHEIKNRRHTWTDFSYGLHRVCFGLFKKVFVANVLGEWANASLNSDLTQISLVDAWLGLIMFTLQIYFDFSAYSDMAIGLGRMFGFHYLENFNHPYISRSVTEFWRRWHISLSTFFRDYIYIPLGGNQTKAMRNLFIVWGLTGLWHGASWNFVIWGLYFGVFIAFERMFLAKFLGTLPKFLSHIYLLFVVVIGWAIFYFTDFSKLALFLKVLFGFTSNPFTSIHTANNVTSRIFVLVLAIVWCAPLGDWLKSYVMKLGRNPLNQYYGWVFLLILDVVMLLSCTSLLVGQSYNPFLYFRF